MDIYDPNGKKYEGSQDDILAKYASDIKDAKKRTIKKTVLRNGIFVSTVWLGINHSFGNNVLIYETMVFDGVDTFNEIDVTRYGTREEAKKGHTKMAHKYSRKKILKR